IDITVEIQPYSIDNLKEKLEIATGAKDAKFMSRKSGIMFLGMTDQVEEEIAQIDKEDKEQAQKDAQNGQGEAKSGEKPAVSALAK
ncbi:MAG: phage portal protein, partial [Bacteroidales bacterium]|nr:phage portal protein [Bacteroidales bacterium]